MGDARRVLVPIVEGHAEVESLPILIRRWAAETGRAALAVGRPLRASGKGALVADGGVERLVKLATLKPGCAAILVVLDADAACPKCEGPWLQQRAVASSPRIPVAVVEAKRQYEAWLIASAESIAGQRGLATELTCPAEPEEVPNPKEWLRDRMQAGEAYRETLDQPALTACLDLRLARCRCPSFDKLVRSLEGMLPLCRT